MDASSKKNGLRQGHSKLSICKTGHHRKFVFMDSVIGAMWGCAGCAFPAIICNSYKEQIITQLDYTFIIWTLLAFFVHSVRAFVARRELGKASLRPTSTSGSKILLGTHHTLNRMNFTKVTAIIFSDTTADVLVFLVLLRFHRASLWTHSPIVEPYLHIIPSIIRYDDCRKQKDHIWMGRKRKHQLINDSRSDIATITKCFQSGDNSDRQDITALGKRQGSKLLTLHQAQRDGQNSIWRQRLLFLKVWAGWRFAGDRLTVPISGQGYQTRCSISEMYTRSLHLMNETAYRNAFSKGASQNALFWHEESLEQNVEQTAINLWSSGVEVIQNTTPEHKSRPSS